VGAVSTQAEPALRADALRNRRRILEAAAEAFSEGGLDVGVAEIARRAGVGAGTLFRRFPTKEDLIFAIVEERTLELVAAGREALEEEDPALAFRAFMFAGVEMHVRDQGFFDAVVSRINKEDRLRELRDEIVEIAGELLERAQAAGKVRHDVEPHDLPLLMCAAAGAAAPMHGALPDLWRRYVGLILDGLRPGADCSQLEYPAPTLADFDASLTAKTRLRAQSR
jgi:AcrR family transcriptional regulator